MYFRNLYQYLVSLYGYDLSIKIFRDTKIYTVTYIYMHAKYF
jgi:hypothetical protein